MRILLIGEFSNVHWTLAEKFRNLGYEVTVVSTGDGWKNYKRDIDINFKNKKELTKFIISSFWNKTFKGYDIVQLINYQILFSGRFLELNKSLFNYLKNNNGKVVLGAFGDDYFYTKACKENKLIYSPFDSLKYDPNSYANIVLQNNFTKKHKDLNEYIADKSDLIISCMYDYYISYLESYKDKLVGIGLPIDISNEKTEPNIKKNKIKIFIGVQKERTSWKGTDRIISELSTLFQQTEFSQNFELTIAENLPYQEYIQRYNDTNIFIDQLYSYSSGMNGLNALAKGKIVFGGAEPVANNTFYDTPSPIKNISPLNIDRIKDMLLPYAEDKDTLIQQESKNATDFVKKYHNSDNIVQQYLNNYLELL